MRFHSLEAPQPEKTAELREHIKSVGEAKPRLSVLWPMDKTRAEAFLALKNNGPEADIVKKLKKSGDIIEGRIGLALKSVFEYKRYLYTQKPQVRDNASWLLYSKKPLFATRFPEALGANLDKLDKITKELRDKFGKEFLGVTFFGSISKGYWKPDSDVDFMVIAENQNIFNELENKLKEQRIEPCIGCVYSFMLSKQFSGKEEAAEKMFPQKTSKRPFLHIKQLFFGRIHKKKDDQDHAWARPRKFSLGDLESSGSLKSRDELSATAGLFNGIFFGDNNALLRLQEYVLNQIKKSAV